MPIDYSLFKFKKNQPAVIEKARKDSEHDRKLKAAYEVVNDREKNICQVTGVELLASTANERRRREHHHLKGRRVKPEWVYRPERILLCSAFIHKLLQSSALIPNGTDARKPLTFAWNRKIVKPGKEPIRLPAEKVAA